MSSLSTAHYNNQEGISFCGITSVTVITPADRKKAGVPFGMCFMCANAVYAALNVNSGERMALEGMVGGPIPMNADLVGAVEQKFPEGFMAVIASLRHDAAVAAAMPTFGRANQKNTVTLAKQGLANPLISEYAVWCATQRAQGQSTDNPPRHIGKIMVIKEMRAFTQVGLREAKDAIEYLQYGEVQQNAARYV